MEPGQITITRDDGTSLLLHHGTPYRVNIFEPFRREVRADQVGDAPWSDGGWSGAEWRAVPTIPIELSINTGSWSELMSAWWALDAALAPVRTGGDVEVTWNAAGTEYLMYARPRGVALVNQRGRTGRARVTATLTCPDPAIYSAMEHSVSMGLLYRTGGAGVPMRVPVVSYTAVADGEAPVANSGTSPARLLLRITGPVVRPRVSLVTDTTVQTLYLDTVLGENDWLDIDTQKKTVVLNGSVTRLADQFGDWPLLTDDALIRFEADEYNPAARLTARWRDTY